VSLRLRRLRRGDLPAATSIWNEELDGLFPLEPALLELVLFADPNWRPDDATVAELDGRMVGFGWAKRWRSKTGDPSLGTVAFLGGVAVTRSARRKGIGSAILAALERRFAREGCVGVETGGGLLYVAPGIPEFLTGVLRFFAHHGYSSDETVHDLARDLSGYVSPVDLPAARIRSAHQGEERDLLAFLEREFPGAWEGLARWQLAVDADPSDFLLLEVDGRIEGFCRIYRPSSRPPAPSTLWSSGLPQPAGALGPIGVSGALRGKGLGAALLDGALRELVRSGARGCVIDWTGLLKFYGRFGFTPWRTYVRCRKLLVP
jgi:GNAT superfamily N-acetyltransferase